MVKRLFQERLFKQAVLAKVKRQVGTTTYTLERLHWEYWMEPISAPTKHVEGGGGLWRVEAHFWALPPQPSWTWAGIERRRKKVDLIKNILTNTFRTMLSLLLVSNLNEMLYIA